MKKILISIVLVMLASTSQAKVNLGDVDFEAIMKNYPSFENTFNEGFIGIPAGLSGSDKPFYGSLTEAKKQMPDVFKSTEKLPTVFYMQGSGKFSKGPTFREWITGEGGYVFFAPNSHKGKGRPTYSSPVPKDIYEKVHAYRQAEIKYALSRLNEIPFIDKSKMFLMGNSEGAFAAARYAGKEFKGRMILSWTCEPGYYTEYPKVGGSYKNDPFLNIVGRDDAYFGKFSHLNKKYNNEGHCGDALFRYKHAKVVLLPNTGHNVMANPYTKPEVLGFLKMFKDFDPSKK